MSSLTFLIYIGISCVFFHLIVCLPLSASGSFYDRKAEGWHWYESLCDSYQKAEISNQKEKLAKSSKEDPLARMKTFKEKVEKLKAIAVLNPTFQNVKAYMEIQKVLLDKSTQFAQKWLEVVYTTPQLDYILKHPTSQAARHVYLDQQREHIEKRIRTLSQTHGLFFFYSSQCVYCKEFAPIVKSFAQKYQWDVLPISLDGKRLPEFPDSRLDNGTAKALGVQFVPTLLAVEPKTGKVFPLSYGMSTHDHIEERIRVLILKEGNL